MLDRQTWEEQGRLGPRGIVLIGGDMTPLLLMLLTCYQYPRRDPRTWASRRGAQEGREIRAGEGPRRLHDAIDVHDTLSRRSQGGGRRMRHLLIGIASIVGGFPLPRVKKRRAA